MRYLLDTHIWLWSVMEPDRLLGRVARIVGDSKNELWFSPVSVWELTILSRKAGFRVQSEIATWVAKSIYDLRLTEAP